jgi:hypothetical protein
MHISLFMEMQLDSAVSQRPIETETRSAAHHPALPAHEDTLVPGRLLAFPISRCHPPTMEAVAPGLGQKPLTRGRACVQAKHQGACLPFPLHLFGRLGAVACQV